MPQRATLPPIGAEIPAALQSLPAIGEEVSFTAPAPAPVPAAPQPVGLLSKRLTDYGRETPLEGAIGAGKGLLSTIYHGGDAIRRAFGMERVINRPEVQARITPANEAEARGFGAEQMGEYIPAGARALSSAKTLFGRFMAPAIAEGTVAGLQTGGDPEAIITTAGMGVAVPAAVAATRGGFSLARNAAAAAQEGGVGGAVASLVRRASPMEPTELMTRALKPAAKLTKWNANVTLGMRELKATGRPITNVDDLLSATELAKKRVWSQYEQMAGPARLRGTTVDLAPVAEAMEQSIPRKLQLENPGAAVRLQEAAQVYRQRFPLQDAERLLLETNADLESFYGKYPASQRRALAADPEAARLNAQAKAFRDAIYKTLDGPGEGAAARELKRRYGSLLEIETETYRRANVAARQQPESLSEQFSTARAAMDVARGTFKLVRGNPMGAADILGGYAMRDTARFMREQQTTNSLIRRAFESFNELPEAVTMPVHRPPAGLLERGPLVTPPPADRSGRVYDLGIPVTPLSERPALPPGRGARPEFHLPGDVQQDPSGIRTITVGRGKNARQTAKLPGQPLDYEIDATVPVKPGGFRVKQFASHPDQARAAVATPEVRSMLERMKTDLETLQYEPDQLYHVPQHEGRNPFANRPNIPGEAHYTPAVAGSPVGDDLRVISESTTSNRDLAKAIGELLEGKLPKTRQQTAALDAAIGYLEKRAGYRGPALPPDWGKAGADDGFDAFSKIVDDFADDAP